MSVTSWLRQDFVAEPLLYLAIVFTLGLLCGMAVARWRRAMWAAVPMIAFVGVMIGHIWTKG